VIVFVLVGQFVPELVDELEGLRPALMSIASDHVVGQEIAGRLEGVMDFVEEEFELDEMMK